VSICGRSLRRLLGLLYAPGMTTTPTCPEAAACFRISPFVHVESVERSVAFYSKLGLTLGDTLKDHTGALQWAAMFRSSSQIMFARADGAIDPHEQAVIFYMYTADVAGLREHLLARGVPDGGRFVGGPMPVDGRGKVFDLTHPPYMPKGELRVEDPDGYVLLIGQLGR
jgi:hypothetical protein